jgi:hypothetical protein
VPGRVRDDHGLAAGPMVVEQSGIVKSKYWDLSFFSLILIVL